MSSIFRTIDANLYLRSYQGYYSRPAPPAAPPPAPSAFGPPPAAPPTMTGPTRIPRDHEENGNAAIPPNYEENGRIYHGLRHGKYMFPCDEV